MKNKKVALAMTMALGLTTVAGVSAAGVPAHAESVEKTYVVVFNNQASLPTGYETVIQASQGKITRELSKLGAVQVTSSNPNFLAQVKGSSLVNAASPEGHITTDDSVSGSEVEVLPDDSATAAPAGDLYNRYQWDIKQVTGNEEAWNLPGGTGKSVDGKDIVVGVIDTGIDYNHPDIKGNYLYGKSFVPGISDAIDQQGHGTHVAGSIAGKGRIMGVGPDLKLAAYRVFGPSGGAATADIAAALTAAGDDNVDVVNMSLGGYDWVNDPESTPQEVVADILLFNRAIDYAVRKGVTVVGSAGNNGIQITDPFQLTKDLFGPDAQGVTFRSPASPSMIRVASNGQELNRAWYSNYGVGMISVTAPGGDYGTAWLKDYDYSLMDPNKRALSTYKGGKYAWMIGTSMASPKAAGLAGLIIAHHGKDKLTPWQVRNIMQSTATDLGPEGYDQDSGFGLINAVNALKK